MARHSIRHGLRDEVVYLQRWDKAYDNLKSIIEGRDEDYATIIHSLVTNQKVTGRLRKTYPDVLENEDLAKRFERVVLTPVELLPSGGNDDNDAVPRLNVIAR